MKKHVTLTLDDDLIEQAKEQNINLSGAVNELLKEHVRDKTLNFNKTYFVVKCSLCSKEINEGYFHKPRNLILCNGCVSTVGSKQLDYDKSGQAFLDKFPGPNVNQEDLKNGS